MNKSAQIKFGETIGILFIVYLVLIFGVMWYNNKNSDDLRELYLEDAQNRALEKYYYIIYSDLLKTSEQGFEKNSYDLISLISFANYSKTPQGKRYLEGRLGEAVITLKIYESQEVWAQGEQDFEEFVLYNNSFEFRENSQLLRSQVFTSLLPIDDERDGNLKTNLGVLRVEVPFYE